MRVRGMMPLLAAALILLSACTGGPSAKTPESIREGGVLRVALAGENQHPYFYWDESGEARGIEPEIARRLARSLGVDAKFTAYPANGVADAVETGEADIAFAGFERGHIRGRHLIETAGFYVRRPFILTRRGESIQSGAGMSGMTILSNGFFHPAAEHSELEDGIARLTQGSADALILGEFAAYAAVARSEELLQAEVLRGGAEHITVAVMARRSEALYALFDGEIARLLQTGEILKIAAGY